MKDPLLLIGFIFLAAFPSINAQSPPESFYNTDQIQEVRIQFPFDNWTYLLDSLRFNGNGLLAGSVKINGKTYDNVGIRYEADQPFTPGQKRNSLHVQLNFMEEEQNLEGHVSLHFSNTLRDPSMVREVLGFEIARTYMPAPRANYANVYINERLLGLFVNVETIDPVFLEKHFGSGNGAFFLARSHSQYDNFPDGCKQRIYGSLEYEPDPECYLYNFNQLSKGGWDELIEMTRILNQSPEKIETVLNVDRVLWMLAFNNILVNLSSYSGQFSESFYLYRDSFGIFHPVIWDLNLCFGSFKNIGKGSDLRLKQLQELDPLLHSENPYKPLISQLLKQETYKKMYLGHFRSILNDFIKNRKYEERAKTLQQLIQRDFVNDPNKFYRYEDFNISLYSTIGKRSTIPGIVELMDARGEFLEKFAELAVVPPQITDAKVIGREQFSPTAVEQFTIVAKVDKFPKRVRVVYRYSENAHFVEAPMYDDGTNGDLKAADGVYVATLSPGPGETEIEYIIVAENASVMAFDPPDYMWNRHKTSLAEINK